MLRALSEGRLSKADETVFAALVPADHYLRQVLRFIDFDRCHSLVAGCYSARLGRPSICPVLAFKLCFLQFHHALSDRDVFARALTDIAFRFFLGLGLLDTLPHHTALTRFRTRLGPERFTAIFDDFLAQAREHGLVHDDLRLKDATHVHADVAVPSWVALLAQARDRLLDAAAPFDPPWVEAARAEALAIRAATAGLQKEEERLLPRLSHLRRLFDEALGLRRRLGPPALPLPPERQLLNEALGLVRQILDDHADPDKGDRLASLGDEEARWGKHGETYLGYQVDISEDAASELITRVHVLPGNGDEGADTAALVREEEQAHGNDVQAVSQDKAGFRGDLLRELQDPAGLNLEVIVPPVREQQTGGFGPERFSLEVIDGKEVLRCPEGRTTSHRDRNTEDTGWKYRFGKTCEGCPQRQECMREPARAGGRTVTKNDYEKEYQAAREKAKTARYKEVRKQHPKVERKLAEMVRRHEGRRARYRGLGRVLIQFLVTAVVVNVKRMVALLCGAAEAAPA